MTNELRLILMMGTYSLTGIVQTERHGQDFAQAVHAIGLAKSVHMSDLLPSAGEQLVGRIFS